MHLLTPVILPVDRAPGAFPPAYYANLFERMAQVMSLSHESVVATPDSHGFFSCIVKQNTDKDATTVRNTTALRTLQERWHQAAAAFSQRNDRKVFQTHHQDPESDVPGVDFVRMCARNQALRVDAPAIADKLLTLATRVCESRSGRKERLASSSIETHARGTGRRGK